MGIDLTTVVRGLEAVSQIPGRLNRIECGQPFQVYVDCADNADRLAVCLKNLRRVTKRRLICVFGSSDEYRIDERPLLGRVLERATDKGVLTAGLAARANAMQTIHEILDGYDRPARAHVIPSRTQAILWALAEARAGDSVLIAGSHRNRGLAGYEATNTCGDTEIARRWLYDTARETANTLDGAAP
jgi:UDP-N-acetylmuramoyl-L-alanyl-D-glutamate--2,6-diaminopimelate ligase